MNTQELIEDIFSKNIFFEKEVLGVNNERDKLEVMHILSDRIVRDILKEHISFLYIKKLSDFTLKHVINILFQQLANEWISFSIDILDYSKEEALVELQKKNRVKFLHNLSTEYYKGYKDIIFEDISNTFIDLLASMSQSSDKVILVNAVINSDLIANRSILGINSFDQLYRKVISAKKLKNVEVNTLQIKLSNILAELDSNTTDSERKENLSMLLPKYEKKNEDMVEKRLEYFDGSLQRVKMAIFNSLKNGVYNF